MFHVSVPVNLNFWCTYNSTTNSKETVTNIRNEVFLNQFLLHVMTWVWNFAFELLSSFGITWISHTVIICRFTIRYLGSMTFLFSNRWLLKTLMNVALATNWEPLDLIHITYLDLAILFGIG